MAGMELSAGIGPRVSLDSIVYSFKAGDSPETIRENLFGPYLSGISISDVCARFSINRTAVL